MYILAAWIRSQHTEKKVLFIYLLIYLFLLVVRSRPITYNWHRISLVLYIVLILFLKSVNCGILRISNKINNN